MDCIFGWKREKQINNKHACPIQKASYKIQYIVLHNKNTSTWYYLGSFSLQLMIHTFKEYVRVQLHRSMKRANSRSVQIWCKRLG